jgi:hypothetical protein
MPESSKSTLAGESLPTRSVRDVLSRATICETFATESLGSSVERAVRSTFPGASAHFSLDKFDITESESLLLGRNFGVMTDIQTGPNGNLFPTSLLDGVI